jgi:hypothetical protein
MMRFLAIIGIIFWIVFALIKSIPFHVVADDPHLSQSLPKQESVSLGHQVMRKAGKIERHEHSTPLKRKGLHIQFQTLEDLLMLMVKGKVQLFSRAKAAGFDLFFTAYPQGDTVSFKEAVSHPPKLWEIKSGKDHVYFLALLGKRYPAIRSFPTKQVLVSFSDEDLEHRVEQTMTRLQQGGENGILSITRTGDVVFTEFYREHTAGDESGGKKR